MQRISSLRVLSVDRVLCGIDDVGGKTVDVSIGMLTFHRDTGIAFHFLIKYFDFIVYSTEC